LLSATHLVKTYRSRGAARVQALSDVSVDIARSETLGVVGESGSGKSTLARAILALPAPDGGTVRFAGEDVLAATGKELRTVRHNMQMVFQDPLSSLNPSHRIIDIVEMPLLVARRGDAAERRECVMETLRSVGLDGELIGHRRPYELSGGQCQRVSLARALVLRPQLLICDEPVSALDVSVQAQVLNLLEDAKEAYKLTMLFISHDLSVVRSVSDRVMVMYLGKVCEVAPTDALYAAPAHPYTAILLASVPSLDPAARRRAALPTGETPSPLDVPPGCRFSNRCPRASARCRHEEPAIRELAERPGHFVACHHALAPTGEIARSSASAAVPGGRMREPTAGPLVDGVMSQRA
jgi:peptide/nickel transport system ATP-binding protein